MSLPTNWPAMSVADAHARLTAPGAPFEMETKVIRGETLRTYKNAPNSLRDILLLSRTHGSLDYVVYEDERLTYDAHFKAVAKLASILTTDFGVQKGDRIAIAMRNLPEWPVIFWAATAVGAIIVPLNAWMTGPELAYTLSDSGSRFAFVDAERLERIQGERAGLPELERIVVCRDSSSSATVLNWETLVGHTNDYANLPDTSLPAVDIDPEDDATIFYTSGTTGKPKGALGTHRNICTNLLSTAVHVARGFLRRGESVPAPDPDAPKKAFLLTVPLFHATGCHSILIPSLVAGNKLVMMYRWNADRGLELIERERINAFGGVPTIAWQILEHPRLSEFDTSCVESVSYGGAPAPPELVKRIVDAFPGVSPGNGYGLTETSSVTSQNSAEDYRNRPASVGPAVPVCDVKIVDDAGNTLPCGATGELWIRGPNVVKGYWNKPDATEQTFGGGWLRSGDIARIDEEGFIFILDRAKDMLIRGGENIYCTEVEDSLYTHPAVVDAAIVGIPDHILGEEVGAVVQVKTGMTVSAADLQHHVERQLAAFKVPKVIKFMDEPLPRNANGKILKRELKKLFS